MTNKEIINKLKEFELIINEMKETNLKLKEENKQFKQLLDISYAEAEKLKLKISDLEEKNKELEKEKNVPHFFLERSGEKQQEPQKKEKIKINVQCEPNNAAQENTKPEVVENTTTDNKSEQVNTQISLNTISDEWLEKSIILDNESGLLKVVYPSGFDKEYSKKIVNLLLNSYLAKKDSKESKKIFYVLNGKIISNFSVDELKELKNCN